MQIYTLMCFHPHCPESQVFIVRSRHQSSVLYANETNIYYDPDYILGLSRALLRFFPTTFLEIAVSNHLHDGAFYSANIQTLTPFLSSRRTIKFQYRTELLTYLSGYIKT